MYTVKQAVHSLRFHFLINAVLSIHQRNLNKFYYYHSTNSTNIYIYIYTVLSVKEYTPFEK